MVVNERLTKLIETNWKLIETYKKLIGNLLKLNGNFCPKHQFVLDCLSVRRSLLHGSQ